MCIRAAGVIVAIASVLVVQANVHAQVSKSTYNSLGADQFVTGPTTLITSTVTLTQTSKVLVVSDGRYYPWAVDSAGYVFIRIDGVTRSNTSTIDWRNLDTPGNAQQHAFNALGAVTLGAGSHTIELVAGHLAGSFYVGSDSNLSVFVEPASRLLVDTVFGDTNEFNFTTGGTKFLNGMGTWTDLPHSPVLSRLVNPAGADVIALASGRAYTTSVVGDGMWGIYFDGIWPGWNAIQGNTQTQWAVNDLCHCSETQAPMYAAAFFPKPSSGTHTVSLDATEFPIPPNENGVRYRIGADTTLVTLTGGMTVRGRVLGMGTGSNAVSIGPPNNDKLIVSKSISIPAGHHGRVMFIARARLQANVGDSGLGSLWITIDGVPRGSSGAQGIGGSGASQRTLTASYLTTGLQALSQGPHMVRVYARASGTFEFPGPYFYNDVPLVWFD